MLKMCIEKSKTPNDTANILIFDCDYEEIAKKVNNKNSDYKDWGNIEYN